MTQDEQILKLKEIIEQKKAELAKAQKFVPQTNCVLPMDGETHNIKTLSMDKLCLLAVRLNVYILSVKDLNAQGLIIDLPTLSGYTVDLWLSDVMNQINVLKIKDTQNALRNAEAELDKRLSDAKKDEIALANIATLLSKI